MVPATTTPPQLQPYHFLALRKAIDAADIDRAAGHPQTGWRPAPDVHGWRVADQLVELGLFERNIKGQSNPEDLNVQRYRITAAGRAAYRVTDEESTLLSNLWTACNEAVQSGNSVGGWRHWKSVASNWQICDRLVAKGWLECDFKSGPQHKGLGNRSYRIVAEGCRVIDLPYPPAEGKQKSTMTAKDIQLGMRIADGKHLCDIIEIHPTGNVTIMDDDGKTWSIRASDIVPVPASTEDEPLNLSGRYVDPETGEILEVSDEPEQALGDIILNGADDHSTRTGDMVRSAADTAQLIASLQNDLQNALNQLANLSRDKALADRKVIELQEKLDAATKLPNPGEIYTLRQTLEEQRLEINRYKQRVNEAESNGWKGKYTTLERDYNRALEELKQLRQPGLFGAAPQPDVPPVVAPAAPALPEVEIEFVLGDYINPERQRKLTDKLTEMRRDGWQIAYEVIQHGANYYARLERQKPAPAATPTDTDESVDIPDNSPLGIAMQQAIDTANHLHSRSGSRRVEPDQMTIIGLESETGTGDPAGDPFLNALRSGITDPAQLAQIGNAHLMNVAADSYQRNTTAPFQSRPLTIVKA